MSGIMNNYFYGKAGQADYTVEQMPTNRKQLFFTTLKVRFSSMVGVNMLHFLFMLPLLIWMFMGMNTLSLYLGIDATTTEEARETLRSVEPTAVSEYEAYEILEQNYQAIVKKYETVEARNAAFAENGVVSADILDDEGNVVETVSYTSEEWDKLIAEANEHFENYTIALKQARNGNIITTLLIAIPLIALASVGRPGMMFVLRNWARDDHSFVWSDYKEAIKANWKQALPLGFLNGLSFLLFFVAWVTYGELASTSGWAFAIPQGLMIVLLVIWWMMNEIIYVMMVTYDMKFFTLIKNSILMVIARLPIAFLILLGTVAVPLLLSFIPQPYSILALFIVYLLIGFAFVGFVQASFANSCFDKYLNPRIEGAEVNKGLYTPDSDEEAEQDVPLEPVKEDRYWEHKTK